MDPGGDIDAMMAAAEAREASLRRVFTRYDVDGSGTIDASELALLLVDLQFDDRVVDEEFAKADKDASRAISFDEFCVYYNGLLGHIASKTRGLKQLKKRRSRGSDAGRSPTAADASRGASPGRARATGAGETSVGAGGGDGSSGGDDGAIPLPPRPELLRFDSITDEIEAYKRGELVAPSTVAREDDRVACATCGRKFVPASIERHQRICAKAAESAARRGTFKVRRVRRR